MHTRHVVSARDLGLGFCRELFKRADEYRTRLDRDPTSCITDLSGRVALLWFRQPSTRTLVSFEMAAVRLGMSVVQVIDPQFSSEYKGESEDHSMRTVAGYRPDALIIRHNQEGGVARAAASAARAFGGPVPVINAGDGKGEHPTQALIDVYTLLQLWNNGTQQDLSGAHIAIGGDLQGRVPRSLAFLLADYGPEITFISAPELRVGEDVKEYLRTRDISFTEETEIDGTLQRAHFWYWTRTQNDQRTDKEKARLAHVDPRSMQLRLSHVRGMRKGAKILHPMPINRKPGDVSEIEPAIDDIDTAAYWQQSANGLYVRMAVLQTLCSP